MYQDELPDYYFLYWKALQKQAAEKEEDDLLNGEPSVLSVLCRNGASDPLLLGPAKFSKNNLAEGAELDISSISSISNISCRCPTDEPARAPTSRAGSPIYHQNAIDEDEFAKIQHANDRTVASFFRRVARNRGMKPAGLP